MTAHVFDLHDEAHAIWRDRGVRGATLVHVDGHHDAEPAAPSGFIGIGNYVRAAFDEGLVAHVHWVAPDQMWRDAAGRRSIQRVLDETAPVPISVGALAALPVFDVPVLLDVDVDYFFTTGYGRDPVAVRLSEPASTPTALAKALSSSCPRRIVTTVATSITGCFTPFAWKHLGADLAAALDGVVPDPRVGEAALAYRVALQMQAAGEIVIARTAFARALAIDPGYRHPFRTPGHVYRHIGRVEEARGCFVSALELDADDDWARLGLAMLDVAEGDAGTALDRLPKALPEPGALDWWRTRGLAFAGLGDSRRAIDCYTHALSLALAGAVPLHMRTSNRDRRLVDPAHWDDHSALAALYRRTGEARLAYVHEAMAGAALGGQPSGVIRSPAEKHG
jgi:hypothetical protein